MKDADALFAFFEAQTNLERNPGKTRFYRIERMQVLIGELGHPMSAIPTIHIAGSKGKGSTAAFIAAFLRANGSRVGVYTSPHMLDYRERIRVYDGDAQMDLEESYLRCGSRLRRIVEQRVAAGAGDEEVPTTFELLTALAFLVFEDVGCDAVVLETGLGGRLDATNVCTPILTVITSIEREHTDYLGESLTGIAREKAGIAKRGVPMLVAPQKPDVQEAIVETAGNRGAWVVPFASLVVMEDEPAAERASEDGAFLRTRVRFDLRHPAGTVPVDVTLPVVGRLQRVNLALAAAAFYHSAMAPYRNEATADAGQTTERVAQTVDLSGRGEIRSFAGRWWVLDGAHTPVSVGQLVRSLREAGIDEIELIFGAVRGKDIAAMVAHLVPVSRSVTVTRAGTFKPGDPASVAASFERAGVPTTLEPDPAAAIAAVKSVGSTGSGPPIVVAGSFYLVAEVSALMVG